jgi:hypothetical protein
MYEDPIVLSSIYMWRSNYTLFYSKYIHEDNVITLSSLYVDTILDIIHRSDLSGFNIF